MYSSAVVGEQYEETADQTGATSKRRRVQGGMQQCLLGAEGAPTRTARRIMGQGLATLPRALAAVPLPRRSGPFLPLETGRTSGSQRIARLTALLPVGAIPAKPRALERQVWLALERRGLVEAEELRALGFDNKADTWIAALDSRRAERQQNVQERTASFRKKDFQRATKAAEQWLEGNRLRDLLGVQLRS